MHRRMGTWQLRAVTNRRLLLGAAALASLAAGCGSPAGTSVTTNQSFAGTSATPTGSEVAMGGASAMTPTSPATAGSGASTVTAPTAPGIPLPGDCSYVAPEVLVVDDETSWLAPEDFEAPLSTGGYHKREVEFDVWPMGVYNQHLFNLLHAVSAGEFDLWQGFYGDASHLIEAADCSTLSEAPDPTTSDPRPLDFGVAWDPAISTTLCEEAQQWIAEGDFLEIRYSPGCGGCGSGLPFTVVNGFDWYASESGRVEVAVFLDVGECSTEPPVCGDACFSDASSYRIRSPNWPLPDVDQKACIVVERRCDAP